MSVQRLIVHYIHKINILSQRLERWIEKQIVLHNFLTKHVC